MVMLLLGLMACQPAVQSADPTWVGGGWIHSDGEAGGKVLAPRNGRDRWFLPQSNGTEPSSGWPVSSNPDCVTIFDVELGNVDQHIALGGSAPDTVLEWSNDQNRLAIGTFLGELLVVDGWTGEVIHRKQLAETMVKNIQWAQNDKTLYIAEQSPDGSILALDGRDLSEQWRVNLSDWIGRSPLPAGDLYGVYTLPAAYGLEVLEDGHLFVVATHAWTDREGVRNNQSMLLKVSDQGEIVAQWPDSPLDGVFFRPKIDSSVALIPTSKSSQGPANDIAPVGGAILFDLERFSPIRPFSVPPLKPWFSAAFIWEALDRKDELLFLGLSDGRAGLWSTDGTLKQSLPSSTPILAGDVPVVASIGSGFFHGNTVIYHVSDTHIPFGTPTDETHPPAPHPEENSIMVAGLDGSRIWSWRGDHRLQAVTPSKLKNRIIATAGKRADDSRLDLFGALVFVLPDTPNAKTPPRLERFCRTKGPAFFRASSTSDGRIAVAQHPFQKNSNAISGTYTATVFR